MRNRSTYGMMRARKLLSLLAMAGAVASAAAQPHVLWQIGRFDDSSQEFRSQGIDYTNPNSDVVYTVGVSHDSDWVRFQPGPANAQTGGRLHPYTVRFRLDRQPEGLYQLRVAILYETPRLSALRLSINGHQGLFYFHPQLDFAAGDWEGTFVPQTSRDEKVIDIPARWLARGQNTIVFTAVDEPATPQNSQGDIAPGQSGLVYDAISLAQEAQAAYPHGAISVFEVPTIFYRQTANGLDEVVDVFASLHDGARTRGQVKLSVGGHDVVQPLLLDGEFGEELLRFEIPEWQGTMRASVSVDGRRFPVELTAQKKWTLDIVPQEHLDVGFTDYRAKWPNCSARAWMACWTSNERIRNFAGAWMERGLRSSIWLRDRRRGSRNF